MIWFALGLFVESYFAQWPYLVGCSLLGLRAGLYARSHG